MSGADDLEPFRDALNALSPGWAIESGRIRKGNVSVRIESRHEGPPGHYDIAIRLGDDTRGVDLWDCAAGVGETDAARASVAAMVWGATTAPALLEVLTGTGEFATHYGGDDAEGFQGWHTVHGPIGGLGDDDGVSQLQRWWVSAPILPTLARAIGATLAPERPHGIKVLVGFDGVAEVRVDGDLHEGATSALAALDWPRGTGAFVRSYVILVGPEGRQAPDAPDRDGTTRRPSS